MPHIDSALLLPLGTSLALLVWVSYCGAVLVRFSSRIRDWSLLAPLGLAAGCAIFLVCANLVGKLGSVPLAFGAAFLVVSALGVYASVRLWPRTLHIPSRRLTLGVLGWTLLALALAYVCLAIRNQSYFFDFPTHLALAATIARDNLPVRNPFSPVLPSGYHYGAALLVAALSRGTGLPAVTGYQLLAAMQGAALLLMVFSLGREAGKHALWGLACVIGALSFGSLVLWQPFAATPAALTSVLQGDFSQEALLQFPSLRENIELAYPILSFSTDLLWLLIYPHRLASFFTVVALAVLLVGPGSRRWGHASLALAVSLVAAVSLFDETILPLALIALAWPLIQFRRKPQRLLLWSGGILAAVLLVTLQGGSVTDALSGATGTSLPFALHSAGDVVRSIVLAKALPQGWLWLLPPLPLAVSAFIFFWKRWWLGLMLCAFGFAGYIGFHILDFQGEAGTGEFARVANLAFLALALAAPMAVARLLREAPPWRTALVVLVLLPVAIPSLVQPTVSVLTHLDKGVMLLHPKTEELVYTPQITDPAVTRELFHDQVAYADLSRILSDDSVVLTQHPVSFVIATGIPAAFAPTSGLIFFPTHHYIPDPAFYDAYWRLDPTAWRSLGATAVLYDQKTYNSLPPSVRFQVEGSGWFITQYDENGFLLLAPTAAFFRYGTPAASTFSALRSTLTPADTVYLSPGLPYGVGQALVHLLRDHPVSGLIPDPNAHAWMDLNRPTGLAAESAVWHARGHEEARHLRVTPEAALWQWRAPGESAGVYPNATIPAFSLIKLTQGQAIGLQANDHSLAMNDTVVSTSHVRFRSLSVLLAGHPGSVARLCGPTGCVHRNLDGGAWSVRLPLTLELSQFEFSVVQGEVFFAGTLGFRDPLSAVRTTGVVIQPRQIENSIEVDVSYFNHLGWTLGNGVAWQLYRAPDTNENPKLTRPSQLIIFGERGDVGFALGADGNHSEHNFTGAPPLLEEGRALPDGEYHLYLSFLTEHFGAADRIPAARFTVKGGFLDSVVLLPQIAQLSFGTEQSEQFVLGEQ